MQGDEGGSWLWRIFGLRMSPVAFWVVLMVSLALVGIVRWSLLEALAPPEVFVVPGVEGIEIPLNPSDEGRSLQDWVSWLGGTVIFGVSITFAFLYVWQWYEGAGDPDHPDPNFPGV